MGQGIVQAIGSTRSYKTVLENPERISETVLGQGLEAHTAYEIVSIDIADIDVGENIGARLMADQAEADMRVAQAKAEQRRAAAKAASRRRSPTSRKIGPKSSRPRHRFRWRSPSRFAPASSDCSTITNSKTCRPTRGCGCRLPEAARPRPNRPPGKTQPDAVTRLINMTSLALIPFLLAHGRIFRVRADCAVIMLGGPLVKKITDAREQAERVQAGQTGQAKHRPGETAVGSSSP